MQRQNSLQIILIRAQVHASDAFSSYVCWYRACGRSQKQAGSVVLSLFAATCHKSGTNLSLPSTPSCGTFTILLRLPSAQKMHFLKYQAIDMRFRLTGTPGVRRPSKRLAEKTNPFSSLSATAHATGNSVSSPKCFIPSQSNCKHGFTHMHLKRLDFYRAAQMHALRYDIQADTVK